MPVHSQSSSLRSRVTPGVSCTTAARLWVSRLISVDLPTFGKPTIATVPAISRGASTSSVDVLVRRSSRRDRVGPSELVHLDEEVEELADLRLQDRPTPPCSPCRPWAGPRTGSARPRRARSDGSCPASRSASRGSRPGSPARSPAARPSRRPGWSVAGHAALLARALGEEAERAAVPHDARASSGRRRGRTRRGARGTCRSRG